jgi:hypothetical protein
MAPIGGPRSGIVGSGSAIPDSVIHRYNFDDDSDTTTLVDSVGSADGSISGMTYTSNQAVSGLAGDFDGADAEVELPTAEGLPLSFTFSLYPRDVSGTSNTFAAWGFNFGADLGFVIKVDAGSLNIVSGDSGSVTGGTLNADTRYNIGVTVSDTWEFTGYIDGAQVINETIQAQGFDTTSYIGSEGGNNYADCIIDNFDVDNTVLSQSEIQDRFS